jgi:hypothetical protein
MGTSVSLPEKGGAVIPYEPNDDVRRCVEHQEWLERVVPRTVFWTVAATGGLMLLSRYAWHVTGGVLVGGLVILFLAKVAVSVAAAVIECSRRIRFRRAANKLGGSLRRSGTLTSSPCTWYTGAPGAFALTTAGELLLVDRSSGYELLRLGPDQIAGVSVEREVTQVTTTRHSGRSVIGGTGGGLFGGWVSGGRSTSVSHDIEEVSLEIQYQLEVNGPVACSAVPFGPDRRGADAACAMIARMRPESFATA